MTSISPLATIPWSHLKEGKVLEGRVRHCAPWRMERAAGRYQETFSRNIVRPHV